MSGRKRSRAALALVLAALLLCTGCWDSKEIDRMAIIVGSAVDLSEAPGMIDLTLEIANTSQGSGGESGGQGQDGGGPSAFSMLKATGETVWGCQLQIDQNSNRTSMPKHNQVRLFGTALCEQGLKDHIDMFMRDQQSRLEVPMLVVEGNAGEALSAKVAEAQLCGIFLAGMMEDLAQISPYYRVRLIDFMKTLLSGTTGAVIPLVKLFTEEEDKQKISMIGMAVFRDDKMVGRLSNDDGMGYIWALGRVKKSNLYLDEGADKAMLHLPSMDCERKVSLTPEGNVRVELDLQGRAVIAELAGFGHIQPPELLPYLETLAQKEVKDRIYSAFTQAQAMHADIFGFGTSVHRKYPHEWKSMEDNWDAIFQNIELSVTVKVKLSGTGQIVKSIEMMEESNK